MHETTRRTFLRSSAAAAALAVVPTIGAADRVWLDVETPVGSTLYDVETTVGGEFAVGGSGYVLKRADDGWRIAASGGPTGNGNNLYGSDVTDDGERLWFVGSSGAIGEYDVRTRGLNDHSAPNDVTNNFNDVAVTGEAGDANVYVAGDSGKIYYSFENGETGTWNSVTPGSGSNINGVDFHGPRSGHAVDGNKTVFVTDDGSTWEKVGIADANNNFYGVDSDAPDDLTVVGGGGTVYHWDGAEWVREDTGDASLRDVEMDGETGLAVGGGGVVFRRDAEGWTQEATPSGSNLKAVVDTDGLEVAVGASATVLER
ncbi:WD40/YVTN/BNR-like repeat-containing protein [Haloplanus halophilus]|uniref:WD40/YVTN/BNR-like repeat-containing protein n=1 Tax=Haloplanus halophilus TaxID=2949993 RepID=UPI002040F0D9|nr:twin-arginine translocation signal domain-containing protein [Haloplanus sp. GDY1]